MASSKALGLEADLKVRAADTIATSQVATEEAEGFRFQSFQSQCVSPFANSKSCNALSLSLLQLVQLVVGVRGVGAGRLATLLRLAVLSRQLAQLTAELLLKSRQGEGGAAITTN